MDVCLTGPRDDRQMEENLAALARGPMSAEEIAWMRAVGDAVHRRTSRRRLGNPFMQRVQ